jgi:plastocyanin
VPRTVVIAQGGTVTFETFGVHQVAIYDVGTEPEDIDTSILAAPVPGCPPVPLINDPLNRVAILGAQPCAGGPIAVSYTFHDPGRYLIICTFLPHFADFDMYGWVIVK